MANEIRVYERRPATVTAIGVELCLFLYETKFERNSIPFSLTPLSGLPADLIAELSGGIGGEQEKIEAGLLSWELIRVLIPAGFTAQQRRERIIEKYRGHRSRFRREIEQPKLPTVEIIDLPDREQ